MRLRRPLASLLLPLLLAASPCALAAQPRLADDDRARLAEAIALARSVGDSLWPGWSRVPFAVLLVTPTHEFLVGHPRPSADFTPLGRDSLLGGEVLVRGRVFSPSLLATFPAVGGLSTVVVGQPANTEEKTSTGWVLTLLHEHLHQLQHAQPGYWAGVRALDLARGDTTGMWMLQYPFPYEDEQVRDSFAAAARAAADLDTAAFRRAWMALRARLRDDDARYLAFQLWQEGIARWTQHAVAALAARRHAPTAAYAALPDVIPYAEAARRERERNLRQARAADLARSRRDVVYPVGAAIAHMLDAAGVSWRGDYLARPYSLEVLK
ncbi:MAG TPA: hypothetical protein VEA99_16125 [Gemmatimonadaceae bacterium]|nr:hypothetical protein [Gemmatimonadaceae bacterium]